eukprot:672845-Pleurochrysis_carterae.AAC.1
MLHALVAKLKHCGWIRARAGSHSGSNLTKKVGSRLSLASSFNVSQWTLAFDVDFGTWFRIQRLRCTNHRAGRKGKCEAVQHSA